LTARVLIIFVLLLLLCHCIFPSSVCFPVIFSS
jgi:hypothetical protein